eukprot:TRINITY_DN5655_c0_g3_i1.p1 TRINITY_DN5655_c0_g3~~TRINITY_DN5655_c0_g3_i1.p1  ORF type:complete len:241 (-),score=60.90 TRINITY_DN5655_c0_g3_i1:86-808(-)
MTGVVSSLTSDQVEKQLQQMVDFIVKEAEEKIEELRQKALEQFDREKTTLVIKQKEELRKEYTRKTKQLTVKQRIEQSNKLNNARIQVLKAQDDVISETFKTARTMLAGLGEGPEYKKLLQDLIAQGLVKLAEAKVAIKCREKDLPLVKEVLPGALASYKTKTGLGVEITVDESAFLPPAPTKGQTEGTFCSGGVVLSSYGGRINCNNTLDNRLGLAFEGLLPVIRATLFGVSKTRRYLE